MLSTAFINLFVFAEETNSDAINNLQQEISELENKIAQKQQEEQTLQREIDQFNYQIDLTRLKIQQSQEEIIQKEKEIKELAGDIDDLKTRIEKLKNSIVYQEKILGERLRERYKTREESPFFVIFASETVNQLVKKTEYLKVMEQQDKKLLDQMNSTKTAFANQKDIFEDKKEEEETLKNQLEAEKINLENYNADLERQNLEKKSLLEQTKNDENTYQELLKTSRAELEAIQNIVNNINFKNGTEIKKGDPIAIMGNSGYPSCSSGPHLHFEVRKNGQVVNAEKYLNPKDLYVYDYNSGYKTIGTGNWSWPMESPTINQRYGETPWSWRYPSGRHDGIDMEASNKYIYAPKDGIIVRDTMGCYNTVINYAAIDHGDGIVSYYLHIQ